jgi:opacity protein-like surface antigen
MEQGHCKRQHCQRSQRGFHNWGYSWPELDRPKSPPRMRSSVANFAQVGWALGIGVDYAITRNWIANIEFMHVDLGPVRASGTETSEGNTTATLNFSTKLKSDIVRAGIAYKRRVRLKP